MFANMHVMGTEPDYRSELHPQSLCHPVHLSIDNLNQFNIIFDCDGPSWAIFTTLRSFALPKLSEPITVPCEQYSPGHFIPGVADY